MIIVDCEQGTDEWYATRAGVVTGSEMDKLITPTGKPSGQQDEYLALLIGEYVTGEGDADSYTNFWMERGKALEPEARAGYQFMTGYSITEAGFVFKDETKLVGCSPDGLVWDGEKLVGGAEIKCPMARNHVAYYFQNTCPKKYLAQVQGSMWVCGVEWWDFVSHHPSYDLLITRVEKDPVFHAKIDELVPAFLERLVAAQQSDRVQELIAMKQEAEYE